MGELALFVLWAGCAPDPGLVAREAPVPAVPLRRLNRAELDNTVRDLLATTYRPSTVLPPDEEAFGFDNNGEALTTTVTHVAAHEATADRLLDEMMGNIKEFTIVYPEVDAHDLTVAVSGEGVLSFDGWSFWSGEISAPATVDYDGIYRVSGLLFGTPGLEPPQIGLVVDDELVASWAIDAHPAFAVHVTHELFLDPGSHRIAWRLLNPGGPVAGFHAFRLTGPLDPVRGRTAAWGRFLTCDWDFNSSLDCARTALERFLLHAWRRPPHGADVEWALDLYKLGTSEGKSWEDAVQLAMKAVLLHPNFQFRMERDPEPGEVVRALDGYEMASRLSYFLWSSMPDAPLFEAAGSGQLDDAEGVAAAAARLLADQRARALVDDLAGQWWSIRALDHVQPSVEAYPAFDEALRASMKAELGYLAEDFFAGRASLRDVLMRQEAWIDARLASHHGLAWDDDGGWSLARNTEGGRAGLLGTAGWLTLTSNPGSPNTVRRGHWVLEKLLCSAPPPPPADVADMGVAPPVPDEGSVRQQEEALRGEAVCQGCHSVMDPVGHVLGSFDGVGRHSDIDALGYPVDSVVQVEGTTLASLDELAHWLADDPRLPGCVVERTFTWAMGRAPEPADEAELAAITTHFVDEGQSFPVLVDAIVRSRPFRYRSAAP